MPPRSMLEDLIRQVRHGSVAEKCLAADELQKLGRQALAASDVLVSALSDLGEQAESSVGLVGGVLVHRYVRESAVNALGKINPSAAPQLALNVIAGLGGKQKFVFCDSSGIEERNVTFDHDVIAAFERAISTRG